MVLAAFSYYQAWRDYNAGTRWFSDEWMKTQTDTFWTQTLENRQDEALKNWNKSQPDTPVVMQDGISIPRDQFWNYVERNRQWIEEGRKKNQELYSNLAKVTAHRETLIMVSWIAGAAAALGLLLAFYGFWNWRIIQLKLDKLLDMELSKRT